MFVVSIELGAAKSNEEGGEGGEEVRELKEQVRL
jgi:hypothetical protein